MIKVTKWCIKRTPETATKINNWFSSKGTRKLTAKTDFHPGWGSNKSFWSYLHYPLHNGKHLHNKKVRGYTEITFQEFDRYILTRHICFLKEKSGHRDYVLRPDPEPTPIKKKKNGK